MTFGSEFWAAIIGALIGSLAGGIVSFFLQRAEHRENRRIKQKDDLATKQALARSLLFKLMKITTDLFHIGEHVAESYNSDRSEVDQEPWARLTPLANIPDFVEITPSEISLAWNSGNEDNLNDLLTIANIHASTIKLMKRYDETRASFRDRLPAQNFQGNIGELKLTDDQLGILRPLMIEMNTIADGLKERCARDYELATSVLGNTIETMNKTLKLAFQVSAPDELSRGKPN